MLPFCCTTNLWNRAPWNLEGCKLCSFQRQTLIETWGRMTKGRITLSWGDEQTLVVPVCKFTPFFPPGKLIKPTLEAVFFFFVIVRKCQHAFASAHCLWKDTQTPSPPSPCSIQGVRKLSAVSINGSSPLTYQALQLSNPLQISSSYIK